MLSALKKDAERKFNPASWKEVHEIFALAVAPQTKSFNLQHIFEKSWEYDKGVYVCFVNLGKACNRVI